MSGRLRADLAYTTVEEVLATGLHAYIDDLQGRLEQIGEAIFQTFVLYADLSTPAEETMAETDAAGAFHFQSHAGPQNSAVVMQPRGIFSCRTSCDFEFSTARATFTGRLCATATMSCACVRPRMTSHAWSLSC